MTAWTRPMAEQRATTVPLVGRRATTRYLVVIGLAIFCGAALRVSYLRNANFPLNDGGMFYAMVRDLQQADYRLPVYTSYNQASIPFAYPPLAFYLAGGLADLTGTDLLDIFRFLPIILNLLSIAAFAALARALLPSRVASASATFAYALLPMSFLWTIMGGGITRSLGSLCALLLLHQVYVLFQRRGTRTLVLATLLAAATLLSHPEAAWFAAYSVVLFWFRFGRSRRSLLDSCLVGGGALLLSAPWWLLLLSRHGLAMFRVFGDSGFSPFGGLISLILLVSTKEIGFPIIGMLALLGMLAMFARRQYALPIWCVTIALLQARASDQRLIVPLALLVGVAISDVMLPLLTQLSAMSPVLHDRGGVVPVQLPTKFTRRLAVVLCVFAVGYAEFAGLLHGELLGALTHPDRAAMEWAKEQTAPTATFLILGGETWWGDNRYAEWFPALTGHQSVMTVQGYEWLPGFSRRGANHDAAQDCLYGDSDCLEDWSAQTGQRFNYLYVVKNAEAKKDTTSYLRSMLAQDHRYMSVYDSSVVTIYKHIVQEAGEQ